MEYKVIYFRIDDREEQIEFRTDDTGEDVRELFRAAAEARPCDILKLYNDKGNIIIMSERTPANTPNTRYVLEAIIVKGHLRDHESEKTRNDDSLKQETSKIKNTIHILKHRLAKVEKALPSDDLTSPVIEKLKTQTESLSEKLEGMEHLSWLGLSKKMKAVHSSQTICDLRTLPTNREEDRQRIHDKFKAMAKAQLSPEIRENLKKTTFDNWQWDNSEMLILLRQMFLDLGLVFTFNIQMPVLVNWLFEVYTKYNQVPFHNFQHCFMVSQMMYGLIWLIDLPSKMEPLDILTLMISTVCHDIDHPGYNNSYQINACTELALLYNDISPLENHHCAVTFQLLEMKGVNILQHLTPEQFRQVRESVIRCILATDLSCHNEHIASFKAVAPHFDFSNKEHRAKLMIILMKTADNSNECRPMQVSEPWLDCLLQEFFTQGDMEKLEGLPVAPTMDRDTASIPSTQIAFIQLILLPLFEALAELFPQVEADVMQPARRALQYYKDMQAANVAEQKYKRSNGHDHQHHSCV